ncbi:type II toxin-antitoxin system RelE/ParE family toxin [Denitrobaculum tricleocarpae]|uniref:Type II toxin-antitoxin system RelE/ParE family toxin n=1 Tax=Denitrobaculum tricleocarpae TaxID=2591009 RepID=A0A545SYM3_9PROT|nr:type II toxin-antitoxin system RelE/ParE family toxin [Denitrobaculum tricleocarpae]TQV70063.1 type II toxin-antitoxin system RelE/ParE family toxin [Denitrobaculum tricleocarpae]
MRKLSITATARYDLTDIRKYTIDHYGRSGAGAYDALLKQAIRDVWQDPFRPGSKERPEIGPNIRSYHSTLSRERSASDVKSPRRFILYFFAP